MGFKFTKHFKIIFTIACVMFYTKSMAQICSLNKFEVFPDSLNQKQKDTSICVKSCLDLYASFPALNKTTSYSITPITFFDVLPCEGTGSVPSGYTAPVNKHSPTIDLGFNFCFFDKSYSKCIVSDNGYISFDTSFAGGISRYDLSSYPGLPSSNYSDYQNTIMGCCSDLFLPANGSITTQTVGTAPFRVFIVKYIHCGLSGASCTYPTQELDMKIALYETSNIIEVYIKKKTTCTSWNGGLAIQGIQNGSGTVGYTTSGRNNTQWSATNDAKRFTPNGTINSYSLKWYNGPIYLGNGTKQTVCPLVNTWYRAELTINPYCGNSQTITVLDSINAKVKTNSTILNFSNISDTVRCTAQNIQLDASSGGLAYRWNTGMRGRYLKVSRTGVYTCYKITDTLNCFFDSLRFNVYSEKVFIDSASSYGCFTQGLGYLKVNASGGKGSIKYKIGSGSYGAQNVFDSLSYGNYHVLIKDSLGCELDSLFSIVRPTVNITPRNICNRDSTGLIIIQVNNFDGPYTYKLDTGSFVTDTFFTNLKGNTHHITIRNRFGCDYDSTLTTSFISTTLHATHSIQVASGCTGGTPDGSITMTVTGGNPPYRFSKNFGPFTNSNVFSGLSEGTYYISLRDTFGCGIDSMIHVGALAHLYVNGYVVNASCFNTSTASIIINGFGGIPPYTFSFGGAGFSSVNTRTSLGAGTMTVSIRDGRGCVVDTVLPIGQPDPLQFSPTLTNVSCFGGNNGKIIIDAIGGIMPYKYSINGGAFTSNNIFTPLVSGTYTLRIKDYNQCTKDTTVIITQPFPLNFQIDILNTSCYNSSDGDFMLTGFGGTAPYQFSFNGGAFSNATYFDSLARGSYSVRIKDARNCTRDTVIIISSPQKISAVLFLKTVSCFGNSNGTIKVLTSGGTSPYTYSFNNSAFAAIDSLPNAASGFYDISIIDSRGCRFDTSSLLTQPMKLAFVVSIKNVGCFNDSTGEITLSATGGTKPYKYAIGTDTFSFNNIFKKKTSGIYLLRIMDANGCLYDTIVYVTQPTALKINVGITHVTCFNGNNGVIDTKGVGGTPPYNYILNSGTPSTDTVHLDLTSGLYNLSVIDFNGCRFDTVVTINQPTLIQSQLFITKVTCYSGSDGSFKVRSSGGIPPYRFALDTASFKVDSVFKNLKSGTYKVSTIDANNCITDTTFLVPQPSKIITSSIIKNITCYNGNDGNVKLIPGGGTPPYLCSNDSINFTNNFTYPNLKAGKYKFFIKDANNCWYDTTVTVFQSTFITNGLIVTNVSCFNSNDGYLRVVATGGSKPYLYSFNGSAFDTVSMFVNLPIGTYSIQTKDTFNCIKDTTVTLVQPPQIFVKATSTNTQCYNSNNGFINVSATGGVPPFTYAVGNSKFSLASTYSGLSPGSYKVFARDNLGCIRDTTIIITQPDSFSFSAKVINSTCFSGDDGSIRFSVSGATPPYQYAFQQGAFNSDTVQYNLRAGVYTINVRDANNCLMVRKVSVNEPPKPSLIPAEIVRATWDDDSTILLQWRKYPQAYRYTVDSKFILKDVIVDTFFYQRLPQTESYGYQISVIDSCGFLNQKSLMHATLFLKGSIDNSKLITLNWNSYKNWQNGVLYYNIYKFNAVKNLFEIVQTTSDTSYVISVISEDTLSEYIFYIEAVEQSGNLALSVSNKVYLYSSAVIWMPDAFSPNHDGLNDLLLPQGSGIKSYSLSVYNRWGERLFQSTEKVKGWDGQYKGVEVPQGTYIFELNAIGYLYKKEEREFSLHGSFLLMR